MNIIKSGFSFIGNPDAMAILKNIEQAGRVCYKSEDLITDDSAKSFIAKLIKSGHEAMLEHGSVSVKIVCDRGITHELVRHRIASFAQESTRYCNYSKDKFGNEITVIKPCFWAEDSEQYQLWEKSMHYAEEMYFQLLHSGATAQQARNVLPNSLKSEIVLTANIREWRHFFKLRALGIAGTPHPQMLEITIPLLEEMKLRFPVVFDDLII